jgi:ubiquitin-conjugating enzyme E2 J1
MDTDAKGQLGGMDAGEAIRRKMAKDSTQWKCGACGRVNAEVMKEQAEAAAGEEGVKEEEVPEQLRLAFREDLGKGAAGDEAGKAEVNGAPSQNTEAATASAPISAVTRTPATPAVQPTRTVQAPMAQPQQRRAPAAQGDEIPAWIDKAIIGIVFAIIAIIWLRFFA